MTVLHFDGMRDTGRYRYHVTSNGSADTPAQLYHASVGTGARTPNTNYLLPNPGDNSTAAIANPLYMIPLISTPLIVSSGCGWRFQNSSSSNGAILAIGDVILYFRAFTPSIVTSPLSTNNTVGIIYRTAINAGTVLATATLSTAVGTTDMVNSWNHWEMKVDRVSNKIQVRVNENLVIDHNIVNSGVLAGTNYSCTLSPYGTSGSEYGSLQKLWSDWYVNDGDFLGDCRVEILVPSSDAQQQWSRSGGSTSYTLIDEAPANFGDYITSNVSGVTELYGHTSTIEPNIPTGPIIGVRVSSTARPAQGEYPAKKVSNIIKSGSTMSSGVGVRPRTLGNINSCIWEINPDTNNPWTASEISSLQFGVRLESS